MIIHASGDAPFASPYSRKRDETEDSPEVQLLKRLVWVRFRSYWWPALMFQSYTELQEFIHDEMDTMMKAQIAMAIMRQIQEMRNIKVARLLGKSQLEIVEVATQYHDFYSKLPELLPVAISRAQYGKDTDDFLDMHRALDQVEVIVSEVSEKTFSLMPGMGSTTWLQKARERVAKRDLLGDEGDCTFYPELRDQTRGDTSISPVAQERPMSHLLPSAPMPVPSQVQPPPQYYPNNDFFRAQYHAISRLAYDSDSKSIDSLLSTGVLPPQRTISGKAVRFSENRNASTAPVQLKSSLKKQSGYKRIQQSMPKIREERAEARDEVGVRDQKKVSKPREASVEHKSKETRLRKLGRVKTSSAPSPGTNKIRRPPMRIAKERNRVAVPTETHDGHMRQVQEYLLRRQMSEESEKMIAKFPKDADAYQLAPDPTSESEDSSSALSSEDSTEDDNETSVGESLHDAPSKYTEATSQHDDKSSQRDKDLDTFDDYLMETEKTLALLIRKEKERLEEEHLRKRQQSGDGHDRTKNGRQGLERGIERRRSQTGNDVKRVQSGTKTHHLKRSGRSRQQKQKKEPIGFMGCFPADDQYELSVATSYSEGKSTVGKSIDIAPSLESRDIVPVHSDVIKGLMGNKEFLSHQYRQKKGRVEILPGVEGDDIAPGLSKKIDKLVAKKGFFTRHDVLKMIRELEPTEESVGEDSVSMNHNDERERQRVRSNLRRK